MSSEQVTAIERLRELDRRVGYWQWGQDEQFSHHVLYDDGFCFSVCETDSADALPTHAEFIVTLRNEALPLIEALQQSLSEAQADARVFSGSYNALAVDFGRLKEENERLKEELQDTQDDKLYVDSESQMLINENNQLKAENERLRDLLKDACTDLGRMTLLRDKFYCEMETAQTEAVFANREIERLRAGIGRALENLKDADAIGLRSDLRKAMNELEALHDA